MNRCYFSYLDPLIKPAEGWEAAGTCSWWALQPSWHGAGAQREALSTAQSLFCSPALHLCCLFLISYSISHLWDVKCSWEADWRRSQLMKPQVKWEEEEIQSARGTSKLQFPSFSSDCSGQRKGSSALRKTGTASLKSVHSRFTLMNLRAETSLNYL